MTTIVLEVLSCFGFEDGRMIGHSNTGYCRRNRDHFVVFNATLHTDNPAIHFRRAENVVCPCWPARILAPEMIQNARAHLKRLSIEATQ